MKKTLRIGTLFFCGILMRQSLSATDVDTILNIGSAERTNRLTPVVKAVHAAIPSVVSLSTERVATSAKSPWGDDDPFFRIFPQTSKTVSLGSGFIIDESGLILTNAHVIQNATRIEVTTYSGKRYEAREVAEDIPGDIALLRILTPVSDSAIFPPIRFGRSNDLLLGETVISMGNPYGLGGSVAMGIISGIGRKAVYKNKVIFDDIIQINMAVNPGNSGGPLVNLDAETLGMAMSSFKEAEGIGFGIPLAHIRESLVRWLIPENAGEVWLGLLFEPDRYNPSLLIVRQVSAGSPAEYAGFARGDRIIAINDIPIKSTIEAGRTLFKLTAKEDIDFHLDDGRILSVLTEQLPLADGRSLAQMRLGLRLQTLTPKLAAALQYPFTNCVIVTQVPPNIKGVNRGDILLRLNHIPISSMRDVARALRSFPVGSEMDVEFCSVVPSETGETILTRRTQLLKTGE